MESPIHLVVEWLIALAYLAIPVAVVPLARRARDRRSRGLLGLFGALLFLSTLSQLVSVSGVGYGLIELSRLLTAALAVATTLLLWATIPKTLRLPSPRELAASNVELTAQSSSSGSSAPLTRTPAVVRVPLSAGQREASLRSTARPLGQPITGRA